jgi:hypothetical protein
MNCILQVLGGGGKGMSPFKLLGSRNQQSWNPSAIPPLPNATFFFFNITEASLVLYNLGESGPCHARLG